MLLRVCCYWSLHFFMDVSAMRNNEVLRAAVVDPRCCYFGAQIQSVRRERRLRNGQSHQLAAAPRAAAGLCELTRTANATLRMRSTNHVPWNSRCSSRRRNNSVITTQACRSAVSLSKGASTDDPRGGAASTQHPAAHAAAAPHERHRVRVPPARRPRLPAAARGRCSSMMSNTIQPARP